VENKRVYYIFLLECTGWDARLNDNHTGFGFCMSTLL